MDAVARFTELVRGNAPPLDRAALALARGVEPDLDEERWLGELDRLAAGVTSLDALRHRLFVQERFRGNAGNYYDPRNSLLPHVLDRRLGIPITLAVVCIEVGRRAGIALEGVGMPGHFLVRPLAEPPPTGRPPTGRPPTGRATPGRPAPGPGGTLLDVFDGGRVLDLAAAEARFRAVTGAGRDVAFGPHLLTRTPTHAILARMLENLRGIYRKHHRPGDLEKVLRMRLALPGTGPAELLELANALGDQARWIDGARLLEQHVATTRPEPALRDRLLIAARTLRANLN